MKKMTEETKNPQSSPVNKYNELLNNIYYDRMDVDSAMSVINSLVSTGCSKGILTLNDVARVTKALLTVQCELEKVKLSKAP